MTIRAKTLAIFLLTLMTLATLVPSQCLAAAPQPDKPTKLTINIEISDAKVFWNYPYITKDGIVRTPAAVQVVWSAAFGLAPTKTDVVLPGQSSGRLVITTDKSAIVDIQVNVIDAKKVVLGTGSLQVRNNGQAEAFLVEPPESTSPLVTYDTEGSKYRTESQR